MSVEEPPFRLRLKDELFEVRDYPALVVAEVAVDGVQGQAASAGFRVLADYIFGGNARRTTIAMTAPVTLVPTAVGIGRATARGPGTWIVRFTMPQGLSADALPRPRDARVRLRAEPPARVAVIRFSGLAHPHVFEAKAAELNTWMAAHRLHASGPPSLAQYDPPWTLWFMRRNEVMIPVVE